jgi:TPP-dependent 2-oxoacid decarboxylase
VSDACGPLAGVNPPAGTEHDFAAAIVGLIRAAHVPLILVGAEVQRYGLAESVADLIAQLGVSWAGTLLAMSPLSEQDAGFIGVYEPPHSRTAVQHTVANADLLVMLGCVYSGSRCGARARRQAGDAAGGPPAPRKPRLALAVLLHSGQRRSDVVRMGRPHVRDGVL